MTVDNLTVREGTLDGNPVNQYFFGDYMVGSVPVPEATPTPEPSVEEVAEKDLENTEDGKQTDISSTCLLYTSEPTCCRNRMYKYSFCECQWPSG